MQVYMSKQLLIVSSPQEVLHSVGVKVRARGLCPAIHAQHHLVKVIVQYSYRY